MEIELCAVSGYTEVGKNMTAVRIDDEVVIVDMGIDIGSLATQELENGVKVLSTDQLIDIGAVPDDRKIADWKHKVKAIVLGHCHLDHIASVRYLAAKYKAPIIGSPYTIEVLKVLLKDDEIRLPNRLVKMELDNKMKISNNIELELVTVTHSTLQCAVVVLHTKEGMIVYGNDFKFDDEPVFGPKTNYRRLKEIGDSGNVIALVMESMYANKQGHTPGESKAKQLLNDTILEKNHKGRAIFVTMFSSHITRIKSAIEIGEKLKRKVVILGRSMMKYIHAAENIGLVKFSSRAEICGYGSHRKRMLRDINNARDKFFVICTGGQGEPGSILDKILNKQLPFTFKDHDWVIFSCSTIPQPVNIANRERLEKILITNNVEIFKDLHVSGHAYAEDLKNMIKLIKPKHVIPSQGEKEKLITLAGYAEEMGYELNKTVHLMQNGERLKVL